MDESESKVKLPDWKPTRAHRAVLWVAGLAAALILLGWVVIVGFVGFAGVYTLFHHH